MTKDMRMQNIPLMSAVNPQSGKRRSKSYLPHCSTKHTVSDFIYTIHGTGVREQAWATTPFTPESGGGQRKDDTRPVAGVSAL